MKVLEDVVLVSFDAEKGEGKELAEEMKVSGYPTWVFATADGETMDRWVGYAKDEFIEQLAESTSDPTTIREKTARFKGGPNVKDGLLLARVLASRGEYKSALSYVDAIVDLDGAPDVTGRRFDYHSSKYRHDGKNLDDVVAAADAVVAFDGASARDLVNVARTMGNVGRKAKQPELRVPYIEPALNATVDADGYLKEAHQSLAVDFALLIEKDLEEAVELKRVTMKEGWQEDSGQLNAFAWWCFENKVNLAEAEVLARKGVELLPAGKERASIIDTVAEICNARGNCDDAVELMQQAIAEDPDRELFAKQLVRFQEIRAAQTN